VRSRYGARVDWFDSENILAGDDILDGLGSGLNADGHVIERSRFTFMKVFPILAALALSVAAFGQTPICQSPATGPQPYSEVPGGGGIPTHVPGALNEFLGYIPQAYVALPGMPASPLAFCGPAWQPNYEYAVGNLIELSNGTVLQAISCTGLCKSGATQPPGFSGTLFEPSPVGIWASTCSDPSTTATCDTVDATGTPAPVNFGEPYVGADVGSTFVIQSYTPNSAYNGSWVVTASTGMSPYTVSFTASGLGSGDCTKDVGSTNCLGYQQGSQITDNEVRWQDVGPQNENALLTPTVIVTPSASSITTAQALNVMVAVSGGSGNPTPTGLVTLTSGSYISGTTTLSDGSATINIPAGSLAVGTDTLTVTYFGDGNYSMATGVNSVTVTGAETPSFTIAGTAVSLSPGATTGNNSTITVTSVDGFTGMVTLTAAVTSSPAGAQDMPTLSFGSTSSVSVNVTPDSPGTATLTIFTTPATSGALTYPARRGLRWYTASGTGLVAFALLFGTGIGIPARRRNWRARLGMLVLLVALIVIGGLLACGGNGSGGGGNSGTTPGTYTVTVTGKSDSTTATGTITLTVQ
jgi:hypothetical protein